MVGICKLCQKEKKLRRSHIFPEFMYQNIYDENPKRFYSLNVDLEELLNSTKRIEQKGIREYLLCDSCEVKFSKNEEYAAETIYAKRNQNETYIVSQSETPNKDYWLYEYAGFSYEKFKLFLMSLLWRIVISDSYQTPSVRPDLLEKLRLSLLDEDPLDYDDFGCLVQVVKYSKNKLVSKFILQPYVTRGLDSDIINVLIDGFMYSFYLTSKEINQVQKDFFLKPDGTMKIVGRLIFNDKSLWNRIKMAYKFFESAVGLRTKNLGK